MAAYYHTHGSFLGHVFFFFFQAEDGIRDLTVTGVQTCALPIYDAAALEAAVIRGVSRFRDPGRGQGLAGVRKYVGRWGGKLSVRSGTARIAIVPDWDDDVPLEEHLPAFPGAQIQVTIPERIAR